MVRDFPRDELRPLPRIRKYFRENRYVGFGGYDETGYLLCYAMFYAFDYVTNKKKRQRVCLFDYLAVTEKYRDTGIGSEFLQYLKRSFPGSDIVFSEVENADYAEDALERRTRERRMEFYLRNGLQDTAVTARVWNVEYRILEMPHGDHWDPHTQEEIREACEQVYHSVFPPAIYDHYVLVR